MDLLTHISAGVAVGSTIALYSKSSGFKKSAIVCAGAFGGALPDVDAISLWSKFDATFGQLFSLSHTGKEIYSAKFWYSHHAFMHSLVACFLFVILLLVGVYVFRRGFRNLAWSGFMRFSSNNRAVALAFASGFVIHLICDMPTPASSWGGVNLLFPFNVYIGGWGKIWWWNNYDIFLILSAVIGINLLLLVMPNVLRQKLKHFSGVLMAVAAIATAIQIGSRNYDFNSHPYSNNEDQSKVIQEKILGAKLYDKMEKFDRMVPIHF